MGMSVRGVSAVRVLVLIWCIGMALYAALGLLLIVVVKALA